MLGPMRKFLDRYQKYFLVLLAAFLVAVFTIPQRSCQRQQQALIVGTFRGKSITRTELISFRQRWRALGLPFVALDPKDERERVVLNNYLLLLTARQSGIKVGPEAVSRMLRRRVPYRQRIEYIIADPSNLAGRIALTDDELQAYYDANWRDKSRKFEDVKETIRRELQTKRAQNGAAEKIQKARELIAATPDEGDPWKRALRNAADETLGLQYDKSPLFTKRSAASDLGSLAERRSPTGRPQLPDSLASILFKIPVGQPSGILKSRDKLFIFRVIQTSAGFADDNTLIRDDWGWHNGRFVVTNNHKDYGELIRARWYIDEAQARRAFEEFLTLQKLLALACEIDVPQAGQVFGDFLSAQRLLDLAREGAAQESLTTRDTREQFLALYGKQAGAVLAEIPVAPFIKDEPPDRKRVLSFYAERKKGPPHPRSPKFGYLQPEKVQIEYVIARPEQFAHLARVTEQDVKTHYKKNKMRFLGPDGKSPKPLAEVRAAIVQEITTLRARTRATTELKRLRERAQSRRRVPLPLEPLAKDAQLEYRRSPPFAGHQIQTAVPDLADAPNFAKEVFDPRLRPRSEQVDRDETVTLREFGSVLESKGKFFIFRLLWHKGPHALEFAQLSPEQQAQVERDCARWLAVQQAAVAAREVRVGIARELLATIAAENERSVKSAVVKSGAGTEDASPVPPALAEYVKTKLELLVPGEIVPLVKDANAYHTAVTTKIDPERYDAHIEYVRFTPEQFTAELDPPESAVKARARQIRDAAIQEQPDAEPLKTLPEPTEEHIKQARAELIAEWKKKDFRVRYHAYLRRRIQDAFRTYAEAHPLEFDREVTLQLRSSPDFFHADDTYALGGDKAMIEAAFALEPGKLSGVLVGKEAASVLLLDTQEMRDEVKVEFVTVWPEAYDPLTETVTNAEAAQYYEAHKEDFRVPARAKAEFIFASFDNIAKVVEPSVTDEEIKDYYEPKRNTDYNGRSLDDRLKNTIRRLIARQRAEENDAEQAIGAAYTIAGGSDKPLAQTATTLARRKLIAGTTPMLSAEDELLPQVGKAPDLAQQILAAKPGELSGPVKTEDGWVIFRVSETKESFVPPLEVVLPEVRHKARSARFAAKATKALENVRSYLAKNKSATIEGALKRADLADELPFAPTVRTPPYFDRERALSCHGMTTELQKAVFETQSGRTTPVVKTDEGLQFARVIDARKNKLIKVHEVWVEADLFTPMIKVSDEDAKAYYTAHQDKYERPRRYELEYVAPDRRELAAGVNVSDADIEEAYEQLRFWFLDRKASEPGAPVYAPLADVRDEVRYRLIGHRVRRAAEELAERTLALIAKDRTKRLKDIAGEMKELQHVPAVEYEPDGDVPRLLRYVPGLDAFLASAKPGDSSPVLSSPVGPIIVRVIQTHPASVPSFDEVKTQAKADIALVRGLVQAREMAERVLAKITEPTAQAMTDAANTFTVQTKNIEQIKIERLPPMDRADMVQYVRQLARYDAAKVHRLGVLQELFNLRFSRISAPLVTGDKADACFLATLTETRYRRPLEAGALTDVLAQALLTDRLTNLFQMAWADFRPAAGAR